MTTPFPTTPPRLGLLTPVMTSLVVLASVVGLTSSCPSPGATESLRAVLTGRCVLYRTFVNPQAVCPPIKTIDCEAVVDTFIEAFASQDPCNITMSRYDAFLSDTRHDIPADKSIFWEGVYEFVHRYSQHGKRMWTLEDTLTGYMIDGLRFCSSPSEPDGIGGSNTSFCPDYTHTENCSWNAEVSFWSAASRNFASKARGAITIMLNASTGAAFNDDSFFAIWELPNVDTSAVTRAEIWMMHTPGHVIKENCESDSIAALTERLMGRGIPASCSVNPRDALWLLCWDHQDHEECCLDGMSSAARSALVTSGLHLLSLLFLCRVLL